MSAINNLNMQDTVVKSSLVQSVQERDGDVGRAHNQAAQAFQEEVARRAEEAVQTVMQPEQQGIQQRQGGQQQGGGQGRKRRPGEDASPEEKAKDGWSMGADDDGQPHTINIVI